ncbi:hypothetical protein HMPREF0262_02606 [Clostridium sp. ATCC 29733]|nr:hypothetical protein HMPREF0262_02606 [Clostridium sp. ATCC 29733]
MSFVPSAIQTVITRPTSSVFWSPNRCAGLRRGEIFPPDMSVAKGKKGSFACLSTLASMCLSLKYPMPDEIPLLSGRPSPTPERAASFPPPVGAGHGGLRRTLPSIPSVVE